MPRGWISRLKKIPRLWNLTLTYLSQYSTRWHSPTNIFQPEVFFSNLQTAVIFFQKKTYMKLVTSGRKIFFWRIPSPRIPRQVGRVLISRSCDFFKRDIQPRGIFMPLYFFQKNLYLQVCKFEKSTCGWKIFFLRIPSPRILRQVGQGQISRSWYFF